MKKIKTIILLSILTLFLSLPVSANQTVEEIIKGRKAMFSEN